MAPNLAALFGICMIAGMALAVYWPSLHGAFLSDDDRYVTDNELVASSDGLYRMWCTNQLIDYWPLTYTSFWLERRLWDANPAGYRVTNLILHVATSLLVWLILRNLSIPGAFVAALIFTVHPVNVETVAWISQRKELLAAFFFLLSMLWYLRAEKDHRAKLANRAKRERATRSNAGLWYGLSLLAFALAMFSKSSAAVLPLVLLLIAWWLYGRIAPRDVRRVLPFFCIAAVLTAIELWFQTHGDPHPNAPIIQRMAGSGAVVWFYFSKSLLPIQLSFIYPRWDIQVGDIRWWLPLAAVASATVVLWSRRKSPQSQWTGPLLLAWGFFCLTLLPVLGITETGLMKLSNVADHYQHIPLVAVVALVAAVWSDCRRRANGAARAAAMILAVAIVGTCSALSFRQSNLYNSVITLWQATLEQYPHLWSVRNNLGNALLAAGQSQEGIAQYEQALRLNPDSAETHNNLGNALTQIGRPEEAIGHFEQALREKSDSAEMHCNLGNALAAADRPQEAIEQFEQAFRLNPNYAGAYNNLAWLLATSPVEQIRNPSRAVDLARKAVELAPQRAGTLNTLGVALYRAGKFEDAIEWLNKDMRARGGGDCSDWFFLAMAYQRLRQPGDARKWFDRAAQWMEKYSPHNKELLRFRGEAEQLLAIQSPAK